MLKPITIKYLLLVVVVFILSIAAAPVKNTCTLSKDFTVTIHGTSNLHEWEETVEIVTGTGIINRNSDGSFDLEEVIKMNVHSIKSSEGAVMDKKTYEALKADDHPEIIFKLFVPIKSIKSSTKAQTFSSSGSLTIAGVTKKINMKVKILMGENGEMAFEGLQKIKMSDYNIDPPKALLGVLKTHDDITINFKTSFIACNNKNIKKRNAKKI